MKNMKKYVSLGLLVLAEALVSVPAPAAFPSRTTACDGFQAYPSTSISITLGCPLVTLA